MRKAEFRFLGKVRNVFVTDALNVSVGRFQNTLAM
jgi:hypothetical protein